jgi:hypothetical protein
MLHFALDGKIRRPMSDMETRRYGERARVSFCQLRTLARL